MLSKKNRLPGSKIPNILKKGTKKESSLLKIYYELNGNSKFTIICPKKVSKKAVERNKIKRLIREALRKKLDKEEIKINAVILAKKEIIGQKQNQIKESFDSLVNKIK